MAIPFSVYVAQKRQSITSKAAASTVLSFVPASSTVKVDEIFTLDIMLDPGTGSSANQVSFVKLSINFDPTKFTTLSDSLVPNGVGNALKESVDSANYDNKAGKATISLSIGADPTNAVKTKTKIATLQLKATAATTPISPNITFDSAPNTQVLSITSSDMASENVLSTTIPAKITVTSIAVSPTPTISPTRSQSQLPASAPGPKVGLAPVCSSLDINGLENGTAPYSLLFTATGNDSDGTISKISFNFGDSIEDLTTGGGIGISSTSGQLLHTYKTPGIYTAYAILTDNSNNLSERKNSCTKTITINAGLNQPSPTIAVQPLPPVGDGKIIFGLGAIGIIFTIIGGALLLL